MSTACQIVVRGSVVPDPLQTLEPILLPGKLKRMNIAFHAGTGGLHSAEN